MLGQRSGGAPSLRVRRAEERRRQRLLRAAHPHAAARPALPASAHTSSLRRVEQGARGQARTRRSAARLRVPKLRLFP